MQVTETDGLMDSLPCGCKATACDKGWRVEAVSFLCDAHKQGDVVTRDITRTLKAYLDDTRPGHMDRPYGL